MEAERRRGCRDEDGCFRCGDSGRFPPPSSLSLFRRRGDAERWCRRLWRRWWWRWRLSLSPLPSSSSEEALLQFLSRSDGPVELSSSEEDHDGLLDLPLLLPPPPTLVSLLRFRFRCSLPLSLSLSSRSPPPSRRSRLRERAREEEEDECGRWVEEEEEREEEVGGGRDREDDSRFTRTAWEGGGGGREGEWPLRARERSASMPRSGAEESDEDARGLMGGGTVSSEAGEEEEEDGGGGRWGRGREEGGRGARGGREEEKEEEEAGGGPLGWEGEVEDVVGDLEEKREGGLGVSRAGREGLRMVGAAAWERKAGEALATATDMGRRRGERECDESRPGGRGSMWSGRGTLRWDGDSEG